MLMVDAISSLGCAEYRHDEWGVDVTIAGSQKGLMVPPRPVLYRDQRQGARRRPRRRIPPQLLGLGAAGHRPTRTGFFPYTPAVNLLFALNEALDMLARGRPSNCLRPP